MEKGKRGKGEEGKRGRGEKGKSGKKMICKVALKIKIMHSAFRG